MHPFFNGDCTLYSWLANLFSYGLLGRVYARGGVRGDEVSGGLGGLGGGGLRGGGGGSGDGGGGSGDGGGGSGDGGET